MCSQGAAAQAKQTDIDQHLPLTTLCLFVLNFYQSAPREISAFLRSLVNRIGPRGLEDPVEDVCAAAARGIGLVMRRFLSTECHDGANGEGDDRNVARLGGVGNDIFNLVWNALDRLDQYSSCVEV